MICGVIRNMGFPLFGLFLDISLAPLLLSVRWDKVLADLDVDPTARFMLTAGGNRGWGGSTTEVVMGYDINVIA